MESEVSRWRRKWCLRLIIVLVVATLIMSPFIVRSVRIGYHRVGLERAWADRHWQNPLAKVIDKSFSMQVFRLFPASGSAWEREQFHRRQLVGLRFLISKTYTFKNMSSPSDEAIHFFRKQNWEESGKLPYEWWQGHWPKGKSEPTTITIIGNQVAIDKWDRKIALNDIPNYAEVFMTDSDDV